MKFRLLSLLTLAFILFILVGCNNKAVSFEINFDTNGGSIVESVIYDGSNAITLPDNPTKEGFIFDGWFWDNGTFLTPFTANSPLDTPIEEDLTVYAKWVIQDDELSSQLKNIYLLAVQINAFQGTYEEWLETVRGPQGVPGEDGKSSFLRVNDGVLEWQFEGDTTWITLFDLTNLNGSDGESAYDIYIRFHQEYQGTEEEWIDDLVNWRLRAKHTVSFDTGGEFNIPSQMVMHGDKAIKPVDPIKEGYNFDGWYYQDQPWVFIGYPVTSDIVLEAKFTEISYELTYSLDNGSFTTDFVPTAYTINTQTFIIPQPIREGFVFAGWTYGNLYTPTRDIVISQGNHESYQFHANWWELNDTVKVKAALPSLGNPNVLVVLVHWQDENLIHTTYEELKSNFFSESNDISTSYGLDSVSSFLNRSSYGKVSLSGDVFEYTTLKNNAEYLNFHEVANEVIDYFEDIVTWDDYDSNLDSYIDGIYIVFEDYPNYGGPNFVTTINRNVANKTIVKIASISSPGVEVLIHETIHMFGPPDIYAGVNVNPGGSKATSVMDQGLGDIPGIMKYVLGWIDQPIYVKTNELQTITLNSLSTHSNIAIVYPNADETNKNWFIIEYITPEMNNAGYFDLGPLGGLRIWRTNMYIDNEGKINGIDLVEDGMMPSPYEYLEAVNDGDYNYFFFPGDEFTPYSYLSSYYGASYELIGKSTFINDIAFSGIYIDNIQLDGELATFDIRIEEEPQVLEVNVNEYFNTTIEKGNFLNDIDFNLGELTFSIEVVTPEGSMFTFFNEFNEEIFVNLSIDASNRKIKMFVDSENASKITLGQSYNISIPEGLIKTYFESTINIPTFSIAFSEIPIQLTKSNETTFSYQPIENFDTPKFFETNDNEITYFSINDINDSMTNLINMNVMNMLTNEINIITLSNQIDNIIDTNSSYVVSYEIFMFENGNFVTRITLNMYETYYDYYLSSGEWIGSFINDRYGNGWEEVLFTAENRIYLRTSTLVSNSRIAEISFGDTIEILSSEIDFSFTNMFSNRDYSLIETNDGGYVIIVASSYLQYSAYYYDVNGNITLLDNTLIGSYRSHISIYNNLIDTGYFFSVSNEKISAYKFSAETKTLEEIIIFTDIAIKPELISGFSVEFVNGTYMLYFNAVASNNPMNSQTTYIILLDGDLDLMGYYRHGSSTYQFVARPSFISENRIICSTTYDRYNYYYFYLSLEIK